VQVVKAVKQKYVPTPETLRLLEEFRKMVNDCVQIGLASNVTSMYMLCKKAYHELARYSMPTYYRLTAISKATGLLRNYRKTLKKHPEAKRPYASKPMLTDCYAFKIQDGVLRLPVKRRQYVYIPLNHHTQSVVSGYAVRSVTLTTCTVSIAFSKETAMADITGLIGIDRNLDNVTTADIKGSIKRYDLSGATRIKVTYRVVKSRFRRDDVRIRKQIFDKYGKKQTNRVNHILHNVSKQIVADAKRQGFGIVMENLKGIRKLYRKGNMQGREYRARMNGWSYFELQRQIDYKGRWEGVPLFYDNPQKTSSTCAICESKILECTERKVYCHVCNRTVDRDENAALNIVKRGLRFKPVGFAGEAVKGNGKSLILRVDANQLTQQGGTIHPPSS
jgi:putative transposase